MSHDGSWYWQFGSPRVLCRLSRTCCLITFSGLPELEIMAPPRPAADDLICLVLIPKSSLVIPVILVAPMHIAPLNNGDWLWRLDSACRLTATAAPLQFVSRLFEYDMTWLRIFSWQRCWTELLSWMPHCSWLQAARVYTDAELWRRYHEHMEQVPWDTRVNADACFACSVEPMGLFPFRKCGAVVCHPWPGNETCPQPQTSEHLAAVEPRLQVYFEVAPSSLKLS